MQTAADWMEGAIGLVALRPWFRRRRGRQPRAAGRRADGARQPRISAHRTQGPAPLGMRALPRQRRAARAPRSFRSALLHVCEHPPPAVCELHASTPPPTQPSHRTQRPRWRPGQRCTSAPCRPCRRAWASSRRRRARTCRGRRPCSWCRRSPGRRLRARRPAGVKRGDQQPGIPVHVTTQRLGRTRAGQLLPEARRAPSSMAA